MHDFNVLLKFMEDHTPFAFTRFNDGEAAAIFGQNGIPISRGKEIVTQSMKEALTDALHCQLPNYWKGVPCPECFPVWNDAVNRIVRKHDHITDATLFVNRNIERSISEIPGYLSYSIVVSGCNQNWDNLSLYFPAIVGGSIYSIGTPESGAFKMLDSLFEEIESAIKQQSTSPRVFFSCGPASRILIPALYERYKNMQFIDVGSLFDPWTKGTVLRCHHGLVTNAFHKPLECKSGPLPPCSWCN
jgi:hypothetical protein